MAFKTRDLFVIRTSLFVQTLDVARCRSPVYCTSQQELLESRIYYKWQIPINKYKITYPIFRDRNSFRIMFCCIHIGCPSTTQYYIIISNSPIHVNRLKNNDEETVNDDDASIIIVVGLFNADRWQDNGFNNNRLCHYIYSLYMYCMVQCIRENPYACSFLYHWLFFLFFASSSDSSWPARPSFRRWINYGRVHRPVRNWSRSFPLLTFITQLRMGSGKRTKSSSTRWRHIYQKMKKWRVIIRNLLLYNNTMRRYLNIIIRLYSSIQSVP
jgi:hypothetical protein